MIYTKILTNIPNPFKIMNTVETIQQRCKHLIKLAEHRKKAEEEIKAYLSIQLNYPVYTDSSSYIFLIFIIALSSTCSLLQTYNHLHNFCLIVKMKSRCIFSNIHPFIGTMTGTQLQLVVIKMHNSQVEMLYVFEKDKKLQMPLKLSSNNSGSSIQQTGTVYQQIS